MSAMLEARRVCARPAGAEHDAVRDVTLSVRRGEVIALLGPNGSGKSTLLAALGGEIRPRSGLVLLDGEDVRRVSRRRFARRVARLPQEPLCPEGLSVEALVRSGRHAHVGFFARPGRGDEDAVREALEAMELGSLRRRPVERLSGGERRRVWIAMVLAQRADLLLLDEPTAALDLRHQWEVLEHLARLNRDRERTIVAAIHDLEQAAALAHRVALLHRGRLYEVGPPEACVNETALRDVFGVDVRITKQDGALRLQLRGTADPARSL